MRISAFLLGIFVLFSSLTTPVLAAPAPPSGPICCPLNFSPDNNRCVSNALNNLCVRATQLICASPALGLTVCNDSNFVRGVYNTCRNTLITSDVTNADILCGALVGPLGVGHDICKTIVSPIIPDTIANFTEPQTCDNGGTFTMCYENGTQGIYTAIGCIPLSGKGTVQLLLNWAVGIGGGVAFLVMVYGGIQMSLAAGDPKRIKAGQELFTSAFAAIFLLATLTVVLNFVGYNILGLGGLGFSL